MIPNGFDQQELTLKQAWVDSNLLCSFVYTAGTTGVTAVTANQLISAVTAWLAASSA